MTLRRWAIAASGLLTALAACQFTNYVELLVVNASASQQVLDMTALPDGRVLALSCPASSNCVVKTYEGQHLQTSEPLINVSYRLIDASESADVFWAGFTSPSSVLHRYRIDEDNQVQFDGQLSWTPPGSFQPRQLAVGRGSYLYMVGTMTTNGVQRETIVRMTISPGGAPGLFVGTNLRTQTLRGDTLEPLSSLTELDVDQSTGDVYVVDTIGSSESLLGYTESLGTRSMEARFYTLNPSGVSDLLAGENMVGVARTAYSSTAGVFTTTIEVLTRGTEEFVLQASQSEQHRNTNFSFAGYRISEECGYIWTMAGHAYDASTNTVKLFGRHTLCDE